MEPETGNEGSLMEPTPNDKYRQHYAILAKHLLIEKPHLSLYLI